MSVDKIEAEAIRIHNAAEDFEERHWKELKRHKTDGPYPRREWADIKDGFYKKRTRELAAKRLKN